MTISWVQQRRRGRGAWQPISDPKKSRSKCSNPHTVHDQPRYCGERKFTKSMNAHSRLDSMHRTEPMEWGCVRAGILVGWRCHRFRTPGVVQSQARVPQQTYTLPWRERPFRFTSALPSSFPKNHPRKTSVYRFACLPQQFLSRSRPTPPELRLVRRVGVSLPHDWWVLTCVKYLHGI